MKVPLNLKVNGDEVQLLVEPDWTLLRALRQGLGLLGVREGCGLGECGACTVILDGLTVNSCLLPALEAEGRQVLTIEGLAGAEGGLHPIQQAFIDHGAVQCGFCTPGMILSAKALLDSTSDPSEADIRAGLAGNLCRCTGYNQIVEAVRAAALKLREER